METKRKKIFYCITKGNWGGAQRYVFDLATSLDKDLYDITVLLGENGRLEQKLQTSGIKTIVLKELSRNVHFIKDSFTLIKIIKIFRKEKPDIIHLNSSKVGLLGSIAGRLTRVPKIIFTGHGWAFNEDRNQFQKKIIYLLHLTTIALAHKTITVSEQTKKQITKNKYFERKIITIKNGINKIDFLDKNTARNILLEKLPTDIDITGRPWLGTISELHKNKGLKYIIEAIHLLDIKTDDKSALPILIIIGEGERKEKLQQRINRYGLQNNVFLIGRIYEAQKYLKAFDIFTLTSITEALPYVILEAGQAGLPIIASAVGGIPEIITDMENGILIRPKEPEEIQKAISFLLNRPEKIASLSEKIKYKILTDFNLERMVRETISLYS
jgi:glycosyltransferase involved in cell wall biosynthesis